jgi:23S rRNA pseudouridine1911/1915/1917 synthase
MSEGASTPEPYIQETIPEALAGERIDRIVALLTECSRAEAVALISDEQVLVNSLVLTKPSQRLLAEDTVAVLSHPVRPVARVLADASVQFGVVYQDETLIVIDKPAGLVVHPGAGHSGSTLVHGLVAQFPELASVGEEFRPGLVHRLDRGTSGLLVVARTQEAYEDLVGQLSDHSVIRIYTALAWRHFEHPQGVVDAPIGRSRRDPLRMTVAMDGRESRTHYRVDAEFTDPVEVSLITCQLETGRTHQIRVHLASIGHAVVGDDTYGGLRRSFSAPRPFLHARELSFVHPATGEQVSFTSQLPADLQGVLNRFS